ncbi:indolepyruvate ferredoxin oxidoreductase subunit alpha [Lachnoclostridium sp. An169]|uniref:indolepyruvate ferredoxin oxidoreductase subunit alpha n=1 Tax=Lachnoclostridium sp. An169 TaxID=1965569 RepID=UPI001FA852A4|nr:indolepyruvate ferredoxin oxidoreductase subunit alpha [Lachnoclostridium sp. An169]
MSEKRILAMGNEAIALGAVRAGVRMAAGYPGTPSTEILETIAKHNDGHFHVEWSVNEKAAMEVGAGAAYAGARTIVTMKQVGLNVASDPLMSLAYMGVKGGMVIVSADDPGPISSQTEQDTRTFGQFSKLPVFDPSSPEEAYVMIGEAFEFSEKYQTPVLFRPTTRVCHSCASIELLPDMEVAEPEGFIKDTMRWVIFPRTSYLNHVKIEKRNAELSETLSDYERNFVLPGSGKKGVVTAGISYAYTREVLPEGVPLLKISTPHPFPERLAKEFMEEMDEVLVLEELDPMIERELLRVAGKYHLPVQICGKLTGHTKNAGENSSESIRKDLEGFLGADVFTAESAGGKTEAADAQSAAPEKADAAADNGEQPALPVRPPVLCAGCPHRASFYAVKKAMKGKKAVFCGDIGCYTLGNAKPLDMVDTCLCMGAGVTIAQGLQAVEPDSVNFAFIGDSTFFASGITGVVNAVYNKNDIVLVVLDNSTTAMTGHQPHPGTGKTIMGEVAAKISIRRILEGIGVEQIYEVDPLILPDAVKAVQEAAAGTGVRAVIFKSPCIAVTKPQNTYTVNQDACRKCKVCVRELGCPAIVTEGDTVKIDETLCYGCGVCSYVCPFQAIGEVKENE